MLPFGNEKHDGTFRHIHTRDIALVQDRKR
jgi:hypothetical protein